MSADSRRQHWLAAQHIRDLLAAGTDAFRLLDSETLRVEIFGMAGLISSVEDNLPRELVPRVLDSLQDLVSLKVLFARQLVQGPGKQNTPERIWSADPAFGNTLFTTHEAGLAFEVDFSAGYSCGLFLDQRANRLHLRELAPASVLNLFSFTCSFSVFAAAAGATTTNIDLSKQILTRGRRNFELNGLDPAKHRFFADDVFEALPRLARRGEKYPVIVLDPPTFSRGKTGKVFRVEDDLRKLILLSADCLEPGGQILVSTNCSRIPLPRLKRLVSETLPEARKARSLPPLPDFPCGNGAATLWVGL